MFRATFKRIIKAGYLSFRRNGWLSMATVLVMVLVLFVLGNLIFIGAFSATVLNALDKKIDISVYFVSDAPESSILAIKKEIEALPEVAYAEYISRERALEEFREKHKSNALIISALDELGDNPLEASLNIKARDPAKYASISNFLLNKNYPVVDKINYFENKIVIDRLAAIVNTVRGGGALLVVFLAFIAVLVAFNTVRLAIYTMREEIGIMRLVGASRWFIRGPFLVSGVLYGASSAAVTTFLFFPLVWAVSPRLNILVPEFNLFSYFLIHFWEFFGILLGAGVALGVFSSFIAIRRYLDA